MSAIPHNAANAQSALTATAPSTTATTGATAAIGTTIPTQAARGVLVAVHLPLRNSDELDTLIANQSRSSSPLYHHFLTPSQFVTTYGPAASDLAAVDADLRGQGFTTTVTPQAIYAQADQATAEHAFGIHLRAASDVRRDAAASTLLTPSSAPKLDATLTRTGAIVSFSALHLHVDSKHLPQALNDNRYGADGPYWFTDLKQAYGYPAVPSNDGAGRTVAIVIDSDVLDSDTAADFKHEKFTPVPSIVRRPVLGGAPFNINSGDSFEASLDVQQVLGSAPGARVMLYNVPDLSDESILAGYAAIVQDDQADIVSSSFGICELYYTKAYNGGVDYTSILQQYHDIFRQGNAEGITFIAASGDSGAYECLDPSGSYKILGGASSPATDPDVTGVGGTNLQTTDSNTRNSAYVSENADDDPLDPAQGNYPNDVFGSGGGISQIFTKPDYQSLVTTGSKYRTVPDIAMQMGGCPIGALDNCLTLPRSSVVASVGGTFYELIGTSAAAPEFAGLVAIFEAQFGGIRVGNLNYYIYPLAALTGSQTFHDNIPGNNGYASHAGYNLVVGNGTPKAEAFTATFLYPVAGKPWSSSNP